VWDKAITGNENFLRFEIIFCSFNTSKIFRLSNSKRDKIHPTQKPIALYKWLLKNYAKPGDKILDTHVGSGSSIIACIDMGFDYMGFEIDADYYQAMQDRIYQFTRQGTLFDVNSGTA
jgi:site-specific DNA-methyltransferase (adenine-specific)